MAASASAVAAASLVKSAKFGKRRRSFEFAKEAAAAATPAELGQQSCFLRGFLQQQKTELKLRCTFAVFLSLCKNFAKRKTKEKRRSKQGRKKGYTIKLIWRAEQLLRNRNLGKFLHIMLRNLTHVILL